jgi:hypothetical protein
MSDECIHGFVDGLCATCNPKPVPEGLKPAARPTTRSRTATAPRATVRSLRDAARVPSATATLNVLEQRIYHLTHIRNLPSILSERALLGSTEPEVGLSDAAMREERAVVTVPGVTIPGTDGFPGHEASLSTYVPFFLSPDAPQWRSVRDRDEHPRVAKAARVWDPADFVFLVSTVRDVVGSELPFVVADGNAEGAATRFASARDDAERMLRRLHTDHEGAGLLEAELLVPDRFPLEAVTLIGVCNDKVRAAVREVIAGSVAGAAGFAPKVAVYPPWFISDL